MKIMKKPYAWAITYIILLLSFTIYVGLDTFVIARAYVVLDNITGQSESQNTDVVSESSSIDNIENSPFTNETTITDNSYSDRNISVTITEYRENNTSIYVADIYLTSIEYLKTAFANNTYGKNVTQKTSVIADAQNAILAINGDFYGAQTRGYVVRNGEIYRDTSSDASQEDLVIYSDGTFDIVMEGSVNLPELIEDGALQVFSFGPGLLDNGEIIVINGDEVDKAKTTINPRTAIGIIDDLHYVMVVSDGRTTENEGLTLYQLSTFMQGLGVTTAYNLDGGGSSTLYFNGNVINNPTTNGKKFTERSVSDIVFIGY